MAEGTYRMDLKSVLAFHPKIQTKRKTNSEHSVEASKVYVSLSQQKEHAV